MDNELIQKIVDEIMRQLNAPADAQDNLGALVVVSDYIVRQKEAARAIWERFGGRVRVAALQAGYSSPELEVQEMGEQELMSYAALSSDIVLLIPRVSMLQNMARGLDGGCIENIFYRSLLWGKKVHIMLDYTPPPKFKRGTLFQSVAESLDTLVEMGVSVFTYDENSMAGDGLTLVTENEVQEAYSNKNTRIVCQRGAIVTPAARDRAAELNIKIDWQGK